MTQHNDQDRLEHMLVFAKEAIEFAHGYVREDVFEKRWLELSLTRLAEVVGEAPARVSSDCQSEITEIPWPQIVGLRNRLAHGYMDIDRDVLWEIVQKDFPPLVLALEKALSN